MKVKNFKTIVFALTCYLRLWRALIVVVVIVVGSIIGFTARLGQELDVLDNRVPAYGFAHVVDRERGHRARRQTFHFDARAVSADGRGRYADAAAALVQPGVHLHRVQPDLVAQRYQLPRELGRARARQPGHGQHVALVARVLGNQPRGRRVQPDPGHGGGRPPGFAFSRNVHHARVAGPPVHVRQARLVVAGRRTNVSGETAAAVHRSRHRYAPISDCNTKIK